MVRRTTTENEGVVGKLRAEVRELTEKNRLLVVEVLYCAALSSPPAELFCALRAHSELTARTKSGCMNAHANACAVCCAARQGEGERGWLRASHQEVHRGAQGCHRQGERQRSRRGQAAHRDYRVEEDRERGAIRCPARPDPTRPICDLPTWLMLLLAWIPDVFTNGCILLVM